MNSFYCPFCNNISYTPKYIGIDSPILLNVQGAGRRQSGCESCGSTDRERLVLNAINEYFQTKNKEIKILHIAPEKRIREKIIKSKPYIKYICGDLYPKNEYTEKIDITNIKYKDNYFDFIICNHVLEHVQEDTKAMKELYRVISPNGIAILQVPINTTPNFKTKESPICTTDAERLQHFGQIDHVRIYGIDYIERLLNCGFQNMNKENFHEKFSTHGINKNEPLLIFQK